MSRQTILANLAQGFAHCVAHSLGRGNASTQQTRIRKLARTMDRLARRPANRTWRQHAARVHREIERTLDASRPTPRRSSLWAAT